MNNFTSTNKYRRFKAHISIFGTTQVHVRNPYIVAWWSAAFPGFGHLLLSKYLRGFVLFIWEVYINIHANLNLAMVYSFCGEIDRAKDILDTRWILLYIPVYIFGIWDSYRTTLDLNKVAVLAERENAPFNTFSIGALEVNYLDQRNPILAIIWSIFMPGTGQLYIHRILTGFFALIWVVVFYYQANFLPAIHYLFSGNISQSTAVLNPEWLLFLPSIYGFSIYDAYSNTVENNKLFDNNQRNYLINDYQHYRFRLPLRK
ncbi:hypothetical protein [Bacillus sp. CGMCC 1.16541]|uniref:hypothetical protein n=1 Tax=Bacillus sp. CGMCC 1.16541 TaxID=2185143 RepID=UPI000D737C15|nr:hypothetical protein [Bacillus sp. CGMCC 1.16541]